MRTNNASGRAICIMIGAYMLAKCILNAILGGGLNITDTVLAVAAAALMFTGLEYVNFGVAGFLALIAFIHLPANITHLHDNFIYLMEGIVDIGCAVVLCVLPQIKEHFTNKWSEFSELFK